MKKYKILIRCRQESGYWISAPSLFDEANSDRDAVNMARQRSGLSKFDNWKFEAIQIV